MADGTPTPPQGPYAQGPYTQGPSPQGPYAQSPQSPAPPPPPQGPYAPPTPAGTPPYQQYQPTGQPPQYPPQPVKSGKGCWVAGIIIAIVLLLIVGSAAYFFIMAGRKVKGIATTVIDDGRAATNLSVAEASERRYFAKNNKYTDDGTELAQFSTSTPGTTATPSGYPTDSSGYTISYSRGTTPAKNTVSVEICSTGSSSASSVLLQTRASGEKVIATFLNSAGKAYYASGQQSCPSSDTPSSPWGTAPSSWGVLGATTATPTSTRRR